MRGRNEVQEEPWGLVVSIPGRNWGVGQDREAVLGSGPIGFGVMVGDGITRHQSRSGMESGHRVLLERGGETMWGLLFRCLHTGGVKKDRARP